MCGYNTQAQITTLEQNTTNKHVNANLENTKYIDNTSRISSKHNFIKTVFNYINTSVMIINTREATYTCNINIRHTTICNKQYLKYKQNIYTNISVLNNKI